MCTAHEALYFHSYTSASELSLIVIMVHHTMPYPKHLYTVNTIRMQNIYANGLLLNAYKQQLNCDDFDDKNYNMLGRFSITCGGRNRNGNTTKGGLLWLCEDEHCSCLDMSCYTSMIKVPEIEIYIVLWWLAFFLVSLFLCILCSFPIVWFLVVFISTLDSM